MRFGPLFDLLQDWGLQGRNTSQDVVPRRVPAAAKVARRGVSQGQLAKQRQPRQLPGTRDFGLFCGFPLYSSRFRLFAQASEMTLIGFFFPMVIILVASRVLFPDERSAPFSLHARQQLCCVASIWLPAVGPVSAQSQTRKVLQPPQLR